MTSLKLKLQEITDQYIRRNFELLTDYFTKNHQLEGFQFLAQTFNQAGTYTIAHTLKAAPQDILVTRLKGTGTLTWNYDSFTTTTLSVTVAGELSPTQTLELRFYAGTYAGD